MKDDLSKLIVEKCFEKYRRLSKKGKPKKTEWTILSCVVLVQAEEEDVTVDDVITLAALTDDGTGLNKC